MCGPSPRSGNPGHSAMQIVFEISLGKRQRFIGFHRSQGDADAFSGRLIALGGNTADGYQNIRLRIVSGRAAASDRIRNDGEARGLADFAFEVAVYVDDLAGAEIPCFHILGVEKENPSAVEDPTIAIIQSIDRGVELIVATDGGEKKFVRLEVMLRDGANGRASPCRSWF